RQGRAWSLTGAGRGHGSRSVLDNRPATPLGPPVRLAPVPLRMPYVQRDADDPSKLVQPNHVRPVGRRAVRIGVRFEEEAVGAGGGGGIKEWRNEVPQTAARAVRAPPRLLHRMRAVVYDRRPARGPEPREVAHIDHEIAVAEELASFGPRDLGRPAGAALPAGPAMPSGSIHCP